MRPDVRLKIFPFRQSPIHLRAKIEAELDRNVTKGVLEMVGSAISAFATVNVVNKDIESLQSGTVSQNKPPTAPIHNWEFSDKPYSTAYIGFCLTFRQACAIYAHSKWPENIKDPVGSITTEKTVGLPQQMSSCFLVSDKGPQFVLKYFKRFSLQNGILLTLTTTYHPKSNGLAERFFSFLKIL